MLVANIETVITTCIATGTGGKVPKAATCGADAVSLGDANQANEARLEQNSTIGRSFKSSFTVYAALSASRSKDS